MTVTLCFVFILVRLWLSVRTVLYSQPWYDLFGSCLSTRQQNIETKLTASLLKQDQERQELQNNAYFNQTYAQQAHILR